MSDAYIKELLYVAKRLQDQIKFYQDEGKQASEKLEEYKKSSIEAGREQVRNYDQLDRPHKKTIPEHQDQESASAMASWHLKIQNDHLRRTNEQLTQEIDSLHEKKRKSLPMLKRSRKIVSGQLYAFEDQKKELEARAVAAEESAVAAEKEAAALRAENERLSSGAGYQMIKKEKQQLKAQVEVLQLQLAANAERRSLDKQREQNQIAFNIETMRKLNRLEAEVVARQAEVVAREAENNNFKTSMVELKGEIATLESRLAEKRFVIADLHQAMHDQSEELNLQMEELVEQHDAQVATLDHKNTTMRWKLDDLWYRLHGYERNPKAEPKCPWHEDEDEEVELDVVMSDADSGIDMDI